MSNDQLNAELIRAIEEDKPGEVAEKLAAGADPNHIADSGTVSTKLTILVQKGTIAMNPPRKPALAIAAHVGNVEVVNMLLRAGANVDAVDEYGWSPLMFAAQQGWKDTIQTLIGAGADTAHACPAGGAQASALGQVAESHAELVELLLKNPTDAAARQYVLVYAEKYREDGAEKVCEGTTLRIAALALAAGADVDASSEQYGATQTALDRSIRTRNMAFTRFLLENGASLGTDCGARLMVAGCQHHKDGAIVDLLGDFGAVAKGKALDQALGKGIDDLVLAVLRNFVKTGFDYSARSFAVRTAGKLPAAYPLLEALVRTENLPRSIEYAVTVMGEDLYAKSASGTPILRVAKPENKKVILALRADRQVRDAMSSEMPSEVAMADSAVATVKKSLGTAL